MKTSGLEIGPGDSPLQGFDYLDVVNRAGVDYVARWGMDRFPIPDAHYPFVFSSHALEHVPWHQTEFALSEVFRILRPQGEFECWVPDFGYIVKCYHRQVCGDAWRKFNGEQDPMKWVNGRLFTYGPGEENWHRACFDEPFLRQCLCKAGFRDITRIRERTLGVSHGPMDLGMKGLKP